MMSPSNQEAVCSRFNAEFVATQADTKIGIALQTLGSVPVNGLRHLPVNGTSGWYVWAGEVLSTDPDFFKPVHVSHLEQLCPEVIPYLGLAPGWRFLLAPNYEDVWFDPSIVHE
jgi:hypothetical protein